MELYNYMSRYHMETMNTLFIAYFTYTDTAQPEQDSCLVRTAVSCIYSKRQCACTERNTDTVVFPHKSGYVGWVIALYSACL